MIYLHCKLVLSTDLVFLTLSIEVNHKCKSINQEGHFFNRGLYLMKMQPLIQHLLKILLGMLGICTLKASRQYWPSERLHHCAGGHGNWISSPTNPKLTHSLTIRHDVIAANIHRCTEWEKESHSFSRIDLPLEIADFLQFVYIHLHRGHHYCIIPAKETILQ